MGYVLGYTPAAADSIVDFVLDEIPEENQDQVLDRIEAEMARFALNPIIAGPPDDWHGPAFVFHLRSGPAMYAIRASYHFLHDEAGLLVTAFAWVQFSD